MNIRLAARMLFVSVFLATAMSLTFEPGFARGRAGTAHGGTVHGGAAGVKCANTRTVGSGTGGDPSTSTEVNSSVNDNGATAAGDALADGGTITVGNANTDNSSK